jgi:hypothetical protein
MLQKQQKKREKKREKKRYKYTDTHPCMSKEDERRRGENESEVGEAEDQAVFLRAFIRIIQNNCSGLRRYLASSRSTTLQLGPLYFNVAN